MPGEEQDEDDAPGGEQPIGDESDEFVQADTEPEGDSDEGTDAAEDASQEEEPVETEASGETPEDVAAETAEADDAESADSEGEAAESESAEAEVEEAEDVAAAADETPEETTADETPKETAADEKPQKGPDEVFCTSCGEPIKKQAEVCPHCGVRQEGSGSGSGNIEKNPGIAAIASLILPGAGDLYNGELDRAAIVFIAWFVGGIVWGTIITIIGVITLGIGLILAPLYLVTNFVSAYLSYQRTEQINAGELEV